MHIRRIIFFHKVFFFLFASVIFFCSLPSLIKENTWVFRLHPEAFLLCKRFYFELILIAVNCRCHLFEHTLHKKGKTPLCLSPLRSHVLLDLGVVQPKITSTLFRKHNKKHETMHCGKNAGSLLLRGRTDVFQTPLTVVVDWATKYLDRARCGRKHQWLPDSNQRKDSLQRWCSLR